MEDLGKSNTNFPFFLTISLTCHGLAGAFLLPKPGIIGTTLYQMMPWVSQQQNAAKTNKFSRLPGNEKRIK
jgi:hypothetical protein